VVRALGCGGWDDSGWGVLGLVSSYLFFLFFSSFSLDDFSHEVIFVDDIISSKEHLTIDIV
jgi:hypothetical protein